MVREFKKIGAAAAVAGALLASGSSYATVQLSAAGDVLLVPYVYCELGTTSISQQTNTLIGLITFWKTRLGLTDRNGAILPAPAGLANVRPFGTPTVPERVTTLRGSSRKGLVHWYFYNQKSEHILDGVIPVTDNDFVRIDWCGTIQGDPRATTLANKVPGYMLFVDDRFDSAQLSGQQRVVGMPDFALYGHAYMIKGEWASQAFIPVISNPVCTFDVNGLDQPVSDVTCAGVEGQPNGFWINVIKSLTDGYPKISRLVSGIDFTNSVARQVRDVYVRYYLDPALAQENKMVFWFNTNNSSRIAAGETYNSEQVYMRSFSYPLVEELNLITSTPTDPRIPGMIHEELDNGQLVKNTGIIRFGVPEVQSGIEWASSGVVFNMLGLASGSNPSQLQTEMATEGSEYPF